MRTARALAFGCPYALLACRSPGSPSAGANADGASAPPPPSNAASTASAGPAPPTAGQPKWLVAASRALPPLAKAARDQRLSPRNVPPNAAAIDAELDEVAAQAPSAAGLRNAAALLADQSVLAAIDEVDLPPLFDSGGIARGRMDEARRALREAASRCR